VSPRVRWRSGRHRGVTEVVLEVGELHHPGEFSGPTTRARNPLDVLLVGLGRSAREQFERPCFDRRQTVRAERFSAERGELEQIVQPRDRTRLRCDGIRDMLDALDNRVAEPSALPDVTDAGDLLSDCWVHPYLPADTVRDRVADGADIDKRVGTTPGGIPAPFFSWGDHEPASPD
jgi:hypothetical protein